MAELKTRQTNASVGACLVGSSSRKSEISVDLLAGLQDQEELPAELGKHRTGRGCLDVRRLSDIKVQVLEKLIGRSVAELRRRHPR